MYKYIVEHISAGFARGMAKNKAQTVLCYNRCETKRKKEIDKVTEFC